MRYVLVIGEPWNYRHPPVNWWTVLELVRQLWLFRRRYPEVELWVEAA